MRRVVLLTAVSLVALVAGGCRHDGRTLRPAGPGQDSSISTSSGPPDTLGSLGGSDVTDTAVTDTGASAGLTITAPWRDGVAIDSRYTCDGVDVSPALSWSPAPAGTEEIALVLADQDEPDFIHWVIAGIPKDSTSIAEQTVPIGAFEATNGNKVIGYTGPCPPAGQTHTYVLTVYYLGKSTDMGDGAPGLALIDAIQAAEIDEASVTGTFSRP